MKPNKLHIVALCLPFVVCFAALMAKLLLFNHYAYHLAWIGLWQKASAALFISAFVFLLRDRRWLLPVFLFVDLWCVANLVYVRSNNLILDSFALTMAGGMNGFWDSILIFFQPSDLLFPLLTLLAFLPFPFNHSPFTIHHSPFTITIALAILCNYIGEAAAIVKAEDKSLCNDFTLNVWSRAPRENIYGYKFLDTACRTSILHTTVYVPLDYFALRAGHYPAPLPLLPQHEALLDRLAAKPHNEAITRQPMLILLVESLESWVCTPYIMPNLCNFLRSEHVLYANRMNCQTIGAESADGQMIAVSGLLPLHEGATCFRYPNNEFPTLFKAQANRSVIMLPHEEWVWNQVQMSPAYGIDSTLFMSPVDSILFAQINAAVDAGERSILAVTMSTHSPFKSGELSDLPLPPGMPYGMANYIRGMNVVDRGMKQFLDKVKQDSVLSTFTIVITGDHTIFHPERRTFFADYCRAHADFPIACDDEGYVPCIIWSPAITRNTRITDECYQMDIYPTVLALLGAQDYWWKGFGINLLDEQARHCRPCTETQAFDISDRVILNNYFAR